MQKYRVYRYGAVVKVRKMSVSRAWNIVGNNYEAKSSPYDDKIELHYKINPDGTKTLEKVSYEISDYHREIKAFSNKSRQRLFERLQLYDVQYMVTLTFPDWACPDKEQLKTCMKRFDENFRRITGQEYIWKLEYTKKEVPHIHLLLLDDQERDYLERVIASVWRPIVGDVMGIDYNNLIIPDISAIRHSGKAAMYCAFYYTKNKEYQNRRPAQYYGMRTWGHKGRGKHKPKEISEEIIDFDAYDDLKRLYFSLVKYPKNNDSFTIYSYENTTSAIDNIMSHYYNREYKRLIKVWQ